MKAKVLSTVTIAVALSPWLVGCERSQSDTMTSQELSNVEDSDPSNASPNNSTNVSDTENHDHLEGSHGGNIVSIGADSYHVEAVFEAGGQIRLFMLGQDETRIQEVESRPLNGFIKPRSQSNATPIAFAPSPVDGDSEGKTSQFIAQIPDGMIDQPVDVTIPNLQIDGERFRLAFASSESHESGPAMPQGAAGDEAAELYLTPGGAYTLADIEANGNMTASQKFKGRMSAHDMKPQPGDRICPITMTKANPNFSWIIGGKTYLFCCPPCVDEFVRMAKEEPEKLLDPEAYVKDSPENP